MRLRDLSRPLEAEEEQVVELIPACAPRLQVLLLYTCWIWIWKHRTFCLILHEAIAHISSTVAKPLPPSKHSVLGLELGPIEVESLQDEWCSVYLVAVTVS